VGPGLYKLFLFTFTQEVVLGSAVTPIKGARLRSIRMHRPCLALPRLALPRLGVWDLYHYRYQRPKTAVCIVRNVYITAFDYRA
jgi:hypothetical protein